MKSRVIVPLALSVPAEIGQWPAWPNRAVSGRATSACLPFGLEQEVWGETLEGVKSWLLLLRHATPVLCYSNNNGNTVITDMRTYVYKGSFLTRADKLFTAFTIATSRHV